MSGEQPTGITNLRAATGESQLVGTPPSLGQVALEVCKLVLALPKDEQPRVLRATAIICGVENEVKRR